MIHSQSYDTAEISKTKWDEFCNWCAVMDSSRLFRRDKGGGKQTREVVQYLRKGLDCVGLATGDDSERLGVMVKGKENNIYPILALMGDFYVPDVN